MWESSWVKQRTLNRPCRVPDLSCLCTTPNSASLRGMSLYERDSLLKTMVLPGQFMGLRQ